MSASVELRNIGKIFDQTTTLRDVSLNIKPGEFISLVGPSGCGKSTLLRILAGLAPQSSGEVRIDGKQVDGLPPSQRDISMVFQSYALYPHMSVTQNIATPLRMRHLPAPARLPGIGRFWPGQSQARAIIDSEVKKAAELVEIGALLSRKPAALSGGQRQRVALARAIVRQPRVFLMDEPLSNLDARLRIAMRSEIITLHKRLGATFVYVTHDQVEAMTMSDRVAVMMDGEIVQCSAPKTLYDDPDDLRVARFIGSPEINTLSLADVHAIAPQFSRMLGASTAHIDVVAVRPEHIRLRAATGVNQPAHARLERIEQLGPDVLAFLRLEATGHQISARLSDAEFAQIDKAERRLMLDLSPRDALLFGASGHRIRQAAPHLEKEVAHVG